MGFRLRRKTITPSMTLLYKDRRVAQSGGKIRDNCPVIPASASRFSTIRIMEIALLVVLIVLVLVALVLQGVMFRKASTQAVADPGPALERIDQSLRQLPTAAVYRDEAASARKEQAESARIGRDEQASQAKAHREELSKKFDSLGVSIAHNIDTLGKHQRDRLIEFAENLDKLTKASETKADALRKTVEEKLDQLQKSNEKKLEDMRLTVDEKLHKTLETRLGESFKLVSERLELVHKGLGQMQELAGGVSDLKRVMSNVKTRGTWGEVLLGSLIEQVLTPEQYEKNFAVKPRSGERVEYAIKMPGPEEDERAFVYLPIDAKFPREAYERIVQASDQADAVALEAAHKELDAAVVGFARDIRDKYVAPPNTTDFALLFLPTEGLYAELLRRPGLADRLQREFRVNLVGPTTLLAIINALQMGFRTLAIQKRSGEVWKLLGGVKTEFGRFEEWIEAVQKKLHSASKEMDKAAVRTRQINQKLSKVQELPTDQSAGALDVAAQIAGVEDESDDLPTLMEADEA